MKKDILRLDRETDDFSLLELGEAAREIQDLVHTNPKHNSEEMLFSLSIGERIVTSKAAYRRVFPSDLKEGVIWADTGSRRAYPITRHKEEV